MAQSLYELAGVYMALLDQMDEAPEADAEMILDLAESAEESFDEKIEKYAMVLRNVQADVDTLDTEIKRLTERRQIASNNIKRLKNAMMNAMEAVGKTKSGGTIIKVTVAKNGGKQPIALEVPEWELGEEYIRHVIEPDMESIRAQLEKEPEKMAGIAHFEERGKHLLIK